MNKKHYLVLFGLAIALVTAAVIKTAFADEPVSSLSLLETEQTCGKTITDSDNNTYGTTLIGSQCWMTENVRSGFQIPGSQDQGDVTVTSTQKYCYDDDSANCETFGALYQWHTAMALPQACDSINAGCKIGKMHQGICPKGWHVPTDEEWHELELFYADPADETNCDLAHDNGDCSPAAGALKSSDLWNGQAGDNISGFTGLPSGYRDFADHQFYCSGDDECDSGHFWTASVHSDTNAYQRNLYLEDQGVYRGNYAKKSGFGLRCIMDY